MSEPTRQERHSQSTAGEAGPPPLLSRIFAASTMRRAASAAMVVGPTLILINQWDALFGDKAFDWVKAVLSTIVPYCVATYGAIGRAPRRE